MPDSPRAELSPPADDGALPLSDPSEDAICLSASCASSEVVSARLRSPSGDDDPLLLSPTAGLVNRRASSSIKLSSELRAISRRSEERRVGKEGRARRSAYQYEKHESERNKRRRYYVYASREAS